MSISCLYPGWDVTSWSLAQHLHPPPTSTAPRRSGEAQGGGREATGRGVLDFVAGAGAPGCPPAPSAPPRCPIPSHRCCVLSPLFGVCSPGRTQTDT